jgi:membrane protease YdiL (CAAX protease family)
VGALATLVVLSVGWGMLYERTGRLWAPMIAHAAFNAANLWVALKG